MNVNKPIFLFSVEEENKEKSVFFNCQGEMSFSKSVSMSKHNYLQNGTLVRVMKPKPEEDKSKTYICMKYCQFYSLNSAFFTLKKNIMKLESLSSSGMGFVSSDKVEECFNLRKDVSDAFEYIHSVIEMRLAGVDADGFDDLHRPLKSVVLELNSNREQVIWGKVGESPGFHMFHMYLDVWLNILLICHKLSSISHSESPNLVNDQLFFADNHDSCTQAATMIVQKLLHLAHFKYSKMKIHESLKILPFTCICVKELWILLMHLMNERKKGSIKLCFWTLLFGELNNLIKPPENEEIHQEMLGNPDEFESELDSDNVAVSLNGLSVKEPLQFSWWLLYHILDLTKYDCKGNYKTENQVVISWNLVNSLLKMTLHQERDEGLLRLCTCVTAEAVKMWGPDVDVICIWWEYLYKKLNDNFKLKNACTIGNFTYERLDPRGFIDQLRYIQSASYLNQWMSNTSFQGFLRLVCIMLSIKPETWKQLKGRFYSKFHKRRLLEFTETGINNFTLLFGALITETNTDDVISKYSSLMSFCEPSGMSTCRQTAVLTSVFTMMVRCVENEKSVAVIGDLAASYINHVSKKLTEETSGTGVKHELQSLIQVYVNGTEEVFHSSSNLNLGEYKLLCSGLSDILKVCKTADLNKTINMTANIITKLRMLVSDQSLQLKYQTVYRELNASLWKTMYAFVKEHSTSNTPCSQLADVVCGFTLLLNDGFTSYDGTDFSQCFQYFGAGEQVSAKISCSYLCHLLPDCTLLAKVKETIPKWDIFLVKAWLRCNCYVSTSSDEMKQLNRLIVNLPVIQAVASEESRIGCPEDLFCFAGKMFNSSKVFQEKMKLRDTVVTLLADIPKHVSMLLKLHSSDVETCQRVYTLCGKLILHCAPIIYVKSKPDCLLPNFLDRMVLPRMLYKGQMTSAVFEALRVSLHDFVQGIAVLDHVRDPYLKRKLSEIVTHYLARFATKQSVGFHPLKEAVVQLQRKGLISESKTLKDHIFTIVKTEFLGANSPFSHQQAQALHFTRELVKQT